MSKKKTTEQDGVKIPQKKASATKQRIRDHINNKNDVITDDDIKNAKLDTEEVKEEVEKKEAELTTNAEVNEGNEAEGKKKMTPWDVLNE